MSLSGWRRGADTDPPSPLAYPVPLAAAIAAGWSVTVPALVMMLLFTIGWVFSADANSNAGGALTAALSFWLLSHGVPLSADSLEIGLTPLLLTLILVLTLRRFMHWAIRNSVVHSRAGAYSLWLSFAASYAVLGVLVSLVASLAARTNASLVLLLCFAWGLVGGLWGLISAPDLTGPRLPVAYAAAGSAAANRLLEQAPGRLLLDDWELIPPAARFALKSAVRAVLWLAALGTIVVLALAVLRAGEFLAIVSALTESGIGRVELFLLSLLYLPTLAIWSVAVLIGGTLVVGAGTSLSLGGVSLGPLPALPVLALLPPELPTWTWLLLPLPIVGIWLASRPLSKLARQLRGVDRLVVGLIFAVAASGLLTTAAGLASGALGAGRFMRVGPDLVPLAAIVALASGILYGLPLVWSAYAQRRRTARRTQLSD